MNSKKFGLAALAAFGFVFAFEFVVHGVLLKGMYVETAHLWRTEEDSKMLFITMGQIVFALVAAFFFTKICDTEFFKNNGLRYGLMLGLILASPTIAAYCYMPVPLALWMSWVGAETLKGLGAGIVITFVYTVNTEVTA
jgi:hypothetical protein